MRKHERLLAAAIAALMTLGPAGLYASDTAVGPDFAVERDNAPVLEKNYSPFVGDDYPDRVFWGETHLHTSYSYDAGLVGNTLGPAEAYQFAKGQQVISATGVPAKLVRPLDWLVVADHAETMGVPVLIQRSDPQLLKTEIGKNTHDLYGYEKGVPMGGDLKGTDADGAPTFMVYALRDPIGANLDRIQIVKGWLDGKGKTHEKVYDVAWSGERRADRNGNLPPVGNTVDVKNANWTNTIGASELAAVWKDPDFDADQRAFYYARVLEIPTPRWVVYDAFRFGVEIPDEAETTHQERAYTSPIWYTPKQ